MGRRPGKVDIRIILRTTATSSVGTVEMHTGSGERHYAESRGRSCAEVAAATELITALAVDGYGLEPSPEAPSLRRSAHPEPPAPFRNNLPSQDDDAAISIVRRSTSPWHWGAGLAASLTGGVAPSLALGGVGVPASASRDLARARLGSAVSGEYAVAPTVQASWGSVSSLFSGRARGVSLFSLFRGRDVRIGACAGLSTGRGSTASTKVFLPREWSGGRSEWWFTVHPSLRGLLYLGQHGWLELTGGLAVPVRLATNDFLLNEPMAAADTVVYSMPPVAVSFAGVGVAF